MKLIRTRARGAIAPIDITRIARAILNIYHGRKLFDEDGTPIDGATLDNSPPYLEWVEAGMKYNYIPVRAHVHVNFRDGIRDVAFPPTMRTQLDAEIRALNRWGWRQSVYTDHAVGTSQFTVERRDSDNCPGVDLAVVVGEPYHTKNRDNKFTVVISDVPSLIQSSCPGKFPKSHAMVASLTTVALDVAHTSVIDDGFRCIGFAPIHKNITIGPAIHLSRRVGVEAHIYILAGGPPHTSKSWEVFYMIIHRRIEPAPLWPAGEKVHTVKAIADLSKTKSKATDSGACCVVCRVTLFDRYYQIQRDAVRAVICKFCAHWNIAVNAEMNSGNYRIAVTTASTTVSSLAKTLGMSPMESDLVTRLHREHGNVNLRCVVPGKDGALAVLHHAGIPTLVIGDDPYTIGISDPEFQIAIENLDHLPDNSYIFKYHNCFD